MSERDDLRPIVILGPTAGGKSDLAVLLAEALGGQVISADSMQVYRYMDAGTAKPSAALRGRVEHHLIDIVEPTERFSVADWLAMADGLIDQLRGAGVRPIVVGGTNLYLKALLEGLFDGPAADPAFREGLEGVAGGELHARLAAVDPEAAARIHPHDLKKLVRALEVHHLTGRAISGQQRQWGRVIDGGGAHPEGAEASASEGYRHNPVLVGLRWPVEAINRRINRRVKEMFTPEAGRGEAAGEAVGCGGALRAVESLSDEVKRLSEKGLLGTQAREALGYKQVLEHLEGRCTLEEAYEKTKILTRRFAKTQRTWLKRFGGVKWVLSEGCEPQGWAEEILHVIRL